VLQNGSTLRVLADHPKVASARTACGSRHLPRGVQPGSSLPPRPRAFARSWLPWGLPRPEECRNLL